MRKMRMRLAVYILVAVLFLTSGCSSSSAQTVTVPDVVGAYAEDGRNVLSTMGLLPQVTYLDKAEGEPDRILSCEPAAGTSLELGSKVTLVVSKVEEAPPEPELTVPDVRNVAADDARAVLNSMGLIPVLEYENSDFVPENNVIRTSPKTNDPVSQGDKVTLWVSEGPSIIQSTGSYMGWTYLTSGAEDDWEFYSPYIEDGVLYIECYNVTFGTAMEWRDRYEEGHASGTASVNDQFDKTIPVTLVYEKRSVAANESQKFTVKVPLGEIETARPTDLYFRIGIIVNGKDRDVNFNISMTWS